MKVKTAEEYTALRQEIIHWQTRRLTLLAGSVVLVTAILSFLPNAESNLPTAESNVVLARTIVLMLYLVAAIWLARYCSIAGDNISAYIQVFLEQEDGAMWETRYSQLRGYANPILNNLDVWVALAYGSLGLFTVVWPLVKTNAHPALILVLSCILLFYIYSLGKLMDARTVRAGLLQTWQQVQEEELKNRKATTIAYDCVDDGE